MWVSPSKCARKEVFAFKAMAGPLNGGVELAVAAQIVGGAHQVTLGNHEVRVAGKAVNAIKAADDVGHEAVLVIVRAKRSELGQVNGLAATDLLGTINVGEEGVGISSLGVPVDVAAVNGATTLDVVASVVEVSEPVKALTRVATVGDGRCADLSATSILVHPAVVGSSSLLRGHVGLGGMVRLVEAEENLGTRGKALLDIGIPVASVDINITPKGGHVLELLVEVTGQGSPVVGPAALLASSTEGVGETSIVVGNTTLSEALDFPGGRLGLLGMLVKVTVGVEGNGLLSESGHGGEGNNLVGVHVC